MQEIVKGYVVAYIYKNNENGFKIAKLKTDQNEIIPLVGYFPIFNSEIEYQFTGSFITHPDFGRQFKVETFKKLEIQSLEGIKLYLSSSFFTGIGPKSAEKIVDHLGLDTINKILSDPDCLKEIGMSEKKIARLHQELEENQKNEHILVALYGYGISAGYAMKLLNHYQLETLEKLEEDPFRLMYEIDGFGFYRAYEIARKMGIENNDIRSQKAAIIYTLNHLAYQKGDLYLTSGPLVDSVYQLLDSKIDLTDALDLLIKEGKIINEGNDYFLAPSYYAEIAIAQKAFKLMGNKIEPFDDLDHLVDRIALFKQINYTDTQKEAIITAISNPLVIITGGPGTGKTTIIDGLLSLYADLNKIDLKDKGIANKIALMAPTGRAAKRMKELLGLQANTIHHQLGFDFDGSYKFDVTNPLPQKLIIVDEASMIDVFLAKWLFDAISEDAQVIIVGDQDQLPSVGPGNMLGDMITSQKIPTVSLTQIHRQAKDSKIITLARSINNQQLSNSDLYSSDDVYFYNGSINLIKQIIVDQIRAAIHRGYLLQEDIQVLIPMYKGDLGIDAMNKLLQKEFNHYVTSDNEAMKHGDKTYYISDKVIQLVNDRERHIMNGDIGYVTKIEYDNEEKLFMAVRFDENEVIYYQSDLESLNLAYAISIHKSQGSEYPVVFLPIIRPYMHMLKKELIYTAITRAKKYLLIMGDMSLLKYASNQLAERRKTKLFERLIKHNFSDEDIDVTEELSPYDFM